MSVSAPSTGSSGTLSLGNTMVQILSHLWFKFPVPKEAADNSSSKHFQSPGWVQDLAVRGECRRCSACHHQPIIAVRCCLAAGAVSSAELQAEWVSDEALRTRWRSTCSIRLETLQGHGLYTGEHQTAGLSLKSITFSFPGEKKDRECKTVVSWRSVYELVSQAYLKAEANPKFQTKFPKLHQLGVHFSGEILSVSQGLHRVLL